MSDQESMLPIMQKCFDVFQQNYNPSNSTDSELKSTNEIRVMFNSLTGMDSSNFEIADGLSKCGFEFILIGGDMLWMLEKV
jgi:hypothetical protein